MSSERWLDKQLLIIKQSCLAIGFGQIAAFTAIYWLFLNNEGMKPDLWLTLGISQSILTLTVPYIFTLFSDSSRFFSKSNTVNATNYILSLSIFLWGYPTIFGYQHLELEGQCLYTIIIAGVSSAAVTSVIHSRNMTLYIVLGTLLPYAIVSFHSGVKIGPILSALTLVFIGVLINQIFILHRALKKEFDMSEQNILLLEENKKNTESLIETSKMVSIGQMAGGVAHEINTPLAIISGSVSVLKNLINNDNLDKEFIEKTLNTVEKTVQRIARIVSGLRVVSRDSSTVNIEAISVDDLYEDITGLCSEKFKVNGVTFKSNINSNLKPSTINCDRVQLSQTLLNLLNNAFDAIIKLDQKWIQLDFLQSSHETIIQVTDSGTGVDSKVIQNMFDPFYTTKPVGQGTGLGLSISRSIIENQGGKLTINTKKNHTCFEIRLPKTLGKIA